MNKQKIIKWLSILGKGFAIATGFNTIPGVPAEACVLIFMVASFLKDLCNKIADYLDDGKFNNSIVGLILVCAFLIPFVGCSAGSAKFMRELARDKNNAAVESDFQSVWFTHKIKIVRTGDTNAATAGDGRVSINLPTR